MFQIISGVIFENLPEMEVSPFTTLISTLPPRPAFLSLSPRSIRTDVYTAITESLLASATATPKR